MFNTKRAVAAKKTVIAYAKQAMARRKGALLTGALKMEVLCIYAIPASWTKAKRAAAAQGLVWKTSTPDLDNIFKAPADSLNGIAYADDAQIAVVSVAKRFGLVERTVIRVSELEAWEDAVAASELPAQQARLAV